MNKPYHTIVVIGRFQGPHKPHFELLERAGKLAEQVIVIIGSADQPRTFKNPWTFDERVDMLSKEVQGISSFTLAEYIFEPCLNTIYDNDAWVSRIQAIVAKYTRIGDRIGLLGHKKDTETKEYLEMFPQWETVDLPLMEVMDATTIREMYFSEVFNQNFLTGVMPPSVISFLMKFRETPEFQNIMEEKKVVNKLQELRKLYPYPITSVTVDAVTVQSGHVLLIKRGSHPGKGLWALPGGYFDPEQDKNEVDGILRELEEETLIDVPKKVLRGSIKEVKTFCAIGRSQVGRSITFAAHIVLQGGEWKLPKVKGSDDAAKAKWVPFVDLKREMLFDDHFDIITHFVPLIK
jgi:bifunctional NMN adenylyltransferase/nudix hydrolase